MVFFFFILHSSFISIFVVHAGMNMHKDAPEWDSHEFWKMKIKLMHKNPSSGEKWVVGTWFYTPSQLEDILDERYSDLHSSVFYIFLFYLMNRRIIDLMGNTELIHSTHRDVITAVCILFGTFLFLFV
jgi:hypothetical protein